MSALKAGYFPEKWQITVEGLDRRERRQMRSEQSQKVASMFVHRWKKPLEHIEQLDKRFEVRTWEYGTKAARVSRLNGRQLATEI